MKGWRIWFFVGLVTAVLIAVYIVGIAVPSFAAGFGGLSNLVPFLAALLTFYYVILTASMVQTMSRAQEEEARARVLVTLDFERDEIFLVIRNIGRTPAHAVRIEFEPDIKLLYDEHPERRFIEEPIAFLPPGYVIRSSIGYWLEIVEEKLPMQYEVRLTYSLSWRSKPIMEQYDLNIPRLKEGAEYLALADMSEVARNLHDVASAVKSMDNHRQRILMTLNGIPIVRIDNLDELTKLLAKNTTTPPSQAQAPKSGRIKKAIRVLLGL